MPQIKKVLFVGSKKLGLRCLSVMHKLSPDTLMGVLTIDDRSDTRSVLDAFQEFTSEKNMSLFIVKTRKESEDMIQKLKPEFCIVSGWYWLIGKETLDSVPDGFIGIHPSLLPKYRGGAPVVWGIINGDKKTGVSLFSFTEGMDDGDIWGHREVEILPADYISDVLDKIENETISLLEERYLNILSGKVIPVPQNHKEATYACLRIPEDGFIDFSETALKVFNFIRAQSEPYPGAFTFYKGEKLTVWRARIDNKIYSGTPGQVAWTTEEGVHVVCGDHQSVILEVVQKEGGDKEASRHAIKSIKTRFPSK